MDRVAENLWIGRLSEATDALRAEEVDRAVCVSEKVSRKGFLSFPLSNCSPEKEIFFKAVDKTVEMVSNGLKVLVCCEQGVSRSVGVAAAARARLKDEDIRESVNRIELMRPESNPSEGIIELLREV